MKRIWYHELEPLPADAPQPLLEFERVEREQRASQKIATVKLRLSATVADLHYAREHLTRNRPSGIVIEEMCDLHYELTYHQHRGAVISGAGRKEVSS